MAELSWVPAASPIEHLYFRFVVGGLSGGHSGMEIHLGRANSIKILAELLAKIPEATLCKISGGNLSNAIPRHGEGIFGIPAGDTAAVENMFAAFEHDITLKYRETDPNISLSLLPDSPENESIPANNAKPIIAALHACPNGVIAMSTSAFADRSFPG